MSLPVWPLRNVLTLDTLVGFTSSWGRSTWNFVTHLWDHACICLCIIKVNVLLKFDTHRLICSHSSQNFTTRLLYIITNQSEAIIVRTLTVYMDMYYKIFWGSSLLWQTNSIKLFNQITKHCENTNIQLSLIYFFILFCRPSNCLWILTLENSIHLLNQNKLTCKEYSNVITESEHNIHVAHV